MATTQYSLNNTTLLVLALVFLALALPTSMARVRNDHDDHNELISRLKLDSSSSSNNCWDSLIELQSCTTEVIMFFLNGETYLGPSCCQAIRIIGKQCWPAMFGTIGFTNQEVDVLQDYCDDQQTTTTKTLHGKLFP
ncbi:hypothetical protein CsatB_006793 [Cannabis sativa]|uniref:egg cell-secreted protein 1.1 n=1 Tax=Cannabis sativa TaxID=3483 RepID=UPI0029C9B50D|nr:egg cell-secreted protein 1.1 [Cannabis sativa]